MNKKLTEKIKINLFLFGPEAGIGSDDTTTTDATGTAADVTGTATGDEAATGADTTTTKDPFAVFPDEKSFMSRVSREAKKQMASMLQTLGIKDETTLKGLIEAKTAADEASKTDLQKALDRQAELIAERDSAIDKNNANVKNQEVKAAAIAAGVKPERVNYLIKLMDLGALDLVDGKVDSVLLNSQIKQITSDIPELLGSVNTLPNKGGASFGGTDTTPLSYEKIRKMSKEEIAKQLPAINEFMAANPLKR
jgi:hypothetical protein